MRHLVDVLQEMKKIYGHGRKFTKIAYHQKALSFWAITPQILSSSKQRI
jgi:hypothetical protein